MTTEQEKQKKRPPSYIGAGLALGAAVGVAIDNIGAGIAVGLAIGAGLESYHKEKREREEDDDSS